MNYLEIETETRSCVGFFARIIDDKQAVLISGWDNHSPLFAAWYHGPHNQIEDLRWYGEYGAMSYILSVAVKEKLITYEEKDRLYHAWTEQNPVPAYVSSDGKRHAIPLRKGLRPATPEEFMLYPPVEHMPAPEPEWTAPAPEPERESETEFFDRMGELVEELWVGGEHG